MKTKMIIVALVAAMLGSGCATDQYQRNRNAVNMGVAGALIGGGAMAVLAHNTRGLGDDAAILIPAGTLILGGAGAYIGSELDANRNATYAAMAQANSATVVIQTSNGASLPITLTKGPNGGWIGPRGEWYQNLPPPEQLKPVYGF